uniref:Uncharacterized protein n=1 Tax=Anopheles atroparvus TaxID=41427 RepID=A0AAG5DR00_ANOAO
MVDPITKLQAYYAQNKAKSPLTEELPDGSVSPPTREDLLTALDEGMKSIQKALREMRAECQKHRAQRDTVRAGVKELDQVVTKLKDEKKVKERTHILLEKHVQWLDHGAPTRRSVLITIIITDRRANQMIYHWMPEFCIIQL